MHQRTVNNWKPKEELIDSMVWAIDVVLHRENNKNTRPRTSDCGSIKKTPQMGVLATWMIPWGIKRTREFERHGLSDLP